MLLKHQFDVLYYLKKHKFSSQRDLSEALAISLGTLNRTLQSLREEGLIDEQSRVTPAGIKELKPYKVNNAIIMAAGMSTRFVPLSLEKPKGLLVVKNEVLIERQIEQLLDAGIEDITLVLGYKKEAFFYLEDKYNVSIIINPEYNTKNNIESLYLARRKFANTYICSSDNYFSENVFEEYVYTSYYSAVHVKEKTTEWYMIPDAKNNIAKVTKSGDDGMIMLGHAYWNKEFSHEFKKLIEEHHDTGDYDQNLWEDLLADNIKKLPKMYIREWKEGVINEFDSLDDLKDFDRNYVNNTHSKILKIICKVFDCKEEEIKNIKPIKEGLTNTSFSFELHKEKYVFRYPGEGTEKIINRSNEKEALVAAKELGIDPSFITMDEKEGWKISHYIKGARTPKYSNFEDTKRIVKVLKKLHESDARVSWTFKPWESVLNLEKLVRKNTTIQVSDFDELKANVEKCFHATEKDDVKICFCHCDTYAPNWMFTEDETILIDWEYAGNADPGCDIGTFIMDAMYDIDDSKKMIREYLGKDDDKLMFHFLAYIAIISYHWFVWALYRESCGATMGDALHNWYYMAKKYSKYLINEYQL